MTNISTIPLTGIEDQSASTLPAGVAISSSTCGSSTPLNPGASCTISLSLHAPSTAATLSGSLRERALPSLDSVSSAIGPISITAPLTVTPSAGANGTISPDTVQSVNYGASLVLTATPASGYSVDQWLDNGVVTQTGGTSYTLTNVTANHSVSVSFKAQYTVTPSAGANGSISPSTVQTVDSGGSVSFTATPNTGYSVNQWMDNDVVVQTGGTSYTLANITTNHTVSVSFSIVQYTVTPSAGANGTISPSTVQSVNYGASQVLTATPSTGYSVNEWTDNGVVTQTGGTTYTLTDVTASHTVSVSFSRPVPQLIAVGSNGSTPVIAQSVDGGSDWVQATVSGTPTHQNYTASDCTGNGTDAVCIATGTRNGNTPLLAISSGASWTNIDLTGFTTQSSFSAASCSGSGANAICLAAGGTGSPANPLLRQSIDGGQTWTAPTVSVLNTLGYFNASSCTGSGVNTVCTVAGINKATTPYETLLLVGTIIDNNLSWAVPSNIAALHGAFNTTSCTGSGAIATCIAAGYDGTSAPLVVLSSDGGTTWAVQTIPGFSVTNGSVMASSCTSNNGVDVVCSLVGFNNNTSLPFVVMLNGTTWSVANTSLASSYLNTTSCSGSGANARCIAAGQLRISPYSPILIQSIDSGVTWTAPTFSSGELLTTYGYFSGSNCTGSGVTAICTAVGNSGLFVQSLNGLSSWTNVTVSGLASAYYAASSGT